MTNESIEMLELVVGVMNETFKQMRERREDTSAYNIFYRMMQNLDNAVTEAKETNRLNAKEPD